MDSGGLDKSKFVDLVFQGGGVRGIALVGALSVLEERGFRRQNCAGASAGAIVATLYAAGYTSDELRDTIMGLDYRQFTDVAWEDLLNNVIPYAGAALSIIKDMGIYEGNRFRQWMRERLAAKGVVTFGDLVHPDYADVTAEDGDEFRYRYKVQIIVSDITHRRLLVLPHDALALGVEPDDLNVAAAVRMSMSIPIFFEPVEWTNPRTGEKLFLVDGGMLSNFPVWLFDSEGIPEWPTFGVMLVEDKPMTTLAQHLPPPPPRRGSIGAVMDYLKSLVWTMMEAHDRLYLEKAQFVRTITVPTLGVGTTEFEITHDRVEALYASGRKAAEDFLATWDFQKYIAAFRTGKEHHRRADVAAAMGVPVPP